MFTFIKLFITLSFGMLLLVGSGDSSKGTNTTENNTTNTTTNTTSNTTTETTNTIVNGVTTDGTTETNNTDNTTETNNTNNDSNTDNSNNTDNTTTTNNNNTIQTDENVWNVSDVSEFRQALENSAANRSNDRIVLAKGTYNVASDKLGTFSFDDDEEFNLTIQSEEGLTFKDVILNGNSTEQVFNFKNKENSVLILKNITITNGYSTSHGGGIYSDKHIKLERCTISNNEVNSSKALGGGMYAKGFISIKNSLISYNKTSDNKGGGFYSNGTEITGSTISNNKSEFLGGGFYSKDKATLIDSTISHNNAQNDAGGFYAKNVELNNTIISDNNSTRYGGGFYSYGKVVVKNSKILNNKARLSGGGFYTYLGYTTVSNSVFNNNNAQHGGGYFSDFSSMVINSKFIENNASSGAIFSIGVPINRDRKSYVSNNTFVKNKGSIRLTGIIVNNIFSDNDSTEDIILNGDAKIYNNYIDYTKIEDNGFTAVKKNNLQPASEGVVNLASDNQTPTSSSPIIDKGLNPASTSYKELIGGSSGSYNPQTGEFNIIYPTYNLMVELLKTDLIGNNRVHNETIDIGAIEFASSK